MMNTGIIYKATSPSGKVYIGKTIKKLSQRKREHKHSAYTKNENGEYKFHTKFCNAIRKYGFENFSWEILHENLDDKEVILFEEKEILNYNSNISGYNIEKSSTGTPRSDDTKFKISQKLMGHKPFGNGGDYWRGRKRSEETKRKISETAKRLGIYISKEATQKGIEKITKTYEIKMPNNDIVVIKTKKKVHDYFRDLNNKLGLLGPNRINITLLMRTGNYKGYQLRRI